MRGKTYVDHGHMGFKASKRRHHGAATLLILVVVGATTACILVVYSRASTSHKSGPRDLSFLNLFPLADTICTSRGSVVTTFSALLSCARTYTHSRVQLTLSL